MRQFGKFQEVPPRHNTNSATFTCPKADTMSRRNMHRNRELYVAQWNRRLDFQITEPRLYDGTPTFYDKYMKWYTQNTILQLQRPRAMGPSSIQPGKLLFQAKAPNTLQACKELKKIADDALKRRQETAEPGTREFALDVLLNLRSVLKTLGHNVETDETFSLLQEQLQAEEDQEAHMPGVAAPNGNEGSSTHGRMPVDGSGTSDSQGFSGSKRLRED